MQGVKALCPVRQPLDPYCLAALSRLVAYCCELHLELLKLHSTVTVCNTLHV
jgi:hypothetical protein